MQSFLHQFNLFRKETDSIEIYLIDAYVKPELPHKFTLSFFTSDLCKSKVIIDENYEYPVNDEFSDIHKMEIEITDLEFNGKIVNFEQLAPTLRRLANTMCGHLKFLLPWVISFSSNAFHLAFFPVFPAELLSFVGHPISLTGNGCTICVRRNGVASVIVVSQRLPEVVATPPRIIAEYV